MNVLPELFLSAARRIERRRDRERRALRLRLLAMHIAAATSPRPLLPMEAEPQQSEAGRVLLLVLACAMFFALGRFG